MYWKNAFSVPDQHNQDTYAVFGSGATVVANIKANSVESGNCSNILEKFKQGEGTVI